MTRVHTNTLPAKGSNPDAALLAMIERHDSLWAEWDLAAEDDPRTREFSKECCKLERRIVGTPAHTARGLAAKRRIIKRGELGSYDAEDIIAMILEVDSERITASKPTRNGAGIEAPAAAG
jgi:hypothetical protein